MKCGMIKPTDKSDQADIRSIIESMLEAARRSGSDGVHEFIDRGGFDLPAYLRNVEAGWLLLIRHPAIWLRHKRWVASCHGAGASQVADWEALTAAEQNIAIAEFGRRYIDFDERMRLRTIRQGHQLSFWQFRHLLISLAVTCSEGRVVLRAPSKMALMVLDGIRGLWLVICLGALVGATLQLIAKGCLTCDAYAIFLLLPGMVFIWWLIRICSNGWRDAWITLNQMAVGESYK